jgi:hypothetical protein
MPDPGCDTLQHRLRVLEGRTFAAFRLLVIQTDALQGAGAALLARNEQVRSAVYDALAKLRSLERAVAERPDVAGTRLSHGSQ